MKRRSQLASKQIFMDLVAAKDRNSNQMQGTTVQTITGESSQNFKSANSINGNLKEGLSQVNKDLLSRSRELSNEQLPIMPMASNANNDFGVQVQIASDASVSRQEVNRVVFNQSKMSDKTAGYSTLHAADQANQKTLGVVTTEKTERGQQTQDESGRDTKGDESNAILVQDTYENKQNDVDELPHQQVKPGVALKKSPLEHRYSGGAGGGGVGINSKFIKQHRHQYKTVSLKTNPVTRPISHSTGEGREDASLAEEYKMTVVENAPSYNAAIDTTNEQSVANLAYAVILPVEGDSSSQNQLSSQTLLLSKSQMLRASLSIQNVKIDTIPSISQQPQQHKKKEQPKLSPIQKIAVTSQSTAKISKKDVRAISLRSTLAVDESSQSKNEASLTKKAIDDYVRKKSRYLTSKRVVGDEKIASVDHATQARAGLIANLLGNSREAREISNQFQKMIEVAQDDFNIESFKTLSSELRNNLQKPNQVYLEQIKINPKRAKKLTQIEDFVMIQPTTAESDQYMHGYHDESHGYADNFQTDSPSNSAAPKNMLLAITDGKAKMDNLAIQADRYDTLRQSAPLIKTMQSNLNGREGEVVGNGEDMTFITNILQSDDYDPPVQDSKMLLPQISVKSTNKMKGGNLAQTSLERATSNFQTNEYQLMPSLDKNSENFMSLRSKGNQSAQDVISAKIRPNYQSQKNSAVRNSSDYETSKQNQSSIIGRIWATKASQKAQLTKTRQSMQDFPHSRSRLQREPHQLQFKLASKFGMRYTTLEEKASLNSSNNDQHSSSSLTGVKQRILGEKDRVRHSHLSSYMGRENHVLKQIHKRVKNFDQPLKNQSSRLNFTQGVVSISKLHKNRAGAKTAFRKYSMPPLKSINAKTTDQAKQWKMLKLDEDAEQGTGHGAYSLVPSAPNRSFDEHMQSPGGSRVLVTMENDTKRSPVAITSTVQRDYEDKDSGAGRKESHGNQTEDGQPEKQLKKNASLIISIKAAFDLPNTRTRKEFQEEELGRQTLQRPSIQSKKHQVVPLHSKSIQQFQAQQVEDLHESGGTLVPWTQTDKASVGMRYQTNLSQPRQSISFSQSSREILAKKRIENITMLNQYKQKRMLVSNLQVSKLIRKDMNMFKNQKPPHNDNSQIVRTLPELQQQDQNLAKSISVFDSGVLPASKKHKLTVGPQIAYGMLKNSLLDEQSSDEASSDLKNLSVFPPDRASTGYKNSGAHQSLQTDEDVAGKNDEQYLAESGLGSNHRLINDLLHKSTLKMSQLTADELKLGLNNQSSSILSQSKSNTELLVADHEKQSQSLEQFKDSSKLHLFQQQEKESSQQLHNSMQQQSSPTKNKNSSTSVLLQNQISQYYQNLQNNPGAKGRNSSEKFANVVIQGKNISTKQLIGKQVSNPSKAQHDSGVQPAKVQTSSVKKKLKGQKKSNETRKEAGATTSQPPKQLNSVTVNDYESVVNQNGLAPIVVHMEEANRSANQEIMGRMEKFSVTTSPLAGRTLASHPQTANNVYLPNERSSSTKRANRDPGYVSVVASNVVQSNAHGGSYADPHRVVYNKQGAASIQDVATDELTISSAENKLSAPSSKKEINPVSSAPRKTTQPPAALKHHQKLATISPHKLNINSPFMQGQKAQAAPNASKKHNKRHQHGSNEGGTSAKSSAGRHFQFGTVVNAKGNQAQMMNKQGPGDEQLHQSIGQGPMHALFTKQRGSAQAQKMKNSGSQTMMHQNGPRKGAGAMDKAVLSYLGSSFDRKANLSNLHERKISQVNMSASIDFSDIQNVSQAADLSPALQVYKTGFKLREQRLSADQINELSAIQTANKGGDTLGQTKNTLMNQTFQRDDHSNYSKLQSQVMPTIKIKMVLSNKDSDLDQESPRGLPDTQKQKQLSTLLTENGNESQAASKKLPELKSKKSSKPARNERMETHGSHLIVTEGNAEPLLQNIQMQSVMSKSRSRSRHTVSNESRATHNNKAMSKNQSRENLDLIQVIANNSDDGKTEKAKNKSTRSKKTTAQAAKNQSK